MHKKVFLIITLFILFLSLNAQQLSVKNYNTRDGLPQNQVKDILQDEKGYIWMQTSGGLTKFDGIDFKNYRASDGLSEQNSIFTFFYKNKFYNITLNEMNVIVNDSIKYFGRSYFNNKFNDQILTIDYQEINGETKIVAISNKNYYEYSYEENDFLLKYNFADKEILSDDGSVIFLYENGILLLNDENTNLLRIDTGKLHPIDFPDFFDFKNRTYSFYYLTDGLRKTDFPDTEISDFFVSSSSRSTFKSSLYYFKDLTSKPQQIFTNKSTSYIYEIDESGEYIPYKKDDNAYIVDNTGKIYKVNVNDGTKNDYANISEIDSNIEVNITLKIDNEFWIATNKGIYKYNIDTKHVEHLTAKNGLSKNNISSLFIDREKNIWIATDGNGVDVLSPAKFESYSKKCGIPYSETTATAQTKDGTIWSSTYGGIYKIESGEKPIYFPAGKALKSKDTWGLFTDSKDNIWLGAGNGSIVKFDGIRFKDLTPKSIKTVNFITCFFESKSGHVWAPYYDSILMYKNNKYKVKELPERTIIYNMKYGPDGNVWASCGLNGVYVFSDDGDFIKKYDIDNKLFRSQIVDLIFVDENTLWCPTYGEGLAVFDLKSEKFIKMITEPFENALIMKSGIKDGFGNVWLGTVNGLFEYKDGKFTRYTENEGLLANSVRTGGVFRDRDDNLWFNSSFGLIKVKPYVDIKDKIAPKLSFNYIQVKKDKYANTEDIPELSYSDNSLNFSYIAIDFRDPLNVEYSYFLEGFDNEWSDFNKDKKVRYTNLPHGEFKFHVKARDKSGNISNELNYSFVIPKPFWLQIWFIIIEILLFGSLVYIYVKWRIYKLKEQNRQLERIVAQRTKELQEKNEQIIDSIHYAKRIQKAILPNEDTIKGCFDDFFLIYKPRDIIAGDFYWHHTTEDSHLIAVADCTGHGVPGALLAMIGNILLNEIVKHKRIVEPDQILNELNVSFRTILQQDTDSSATRDGIDIILCKVNHNSQTLTFASARRPLYIVKQENDERTLHQVKGDKITIGGKRRDENVRFTKRQLQLHTGDMIYLTTDGFVDQSNPDNKKFGSRQLKKFFIEYSELPLSVQKRNFVNNLEEHMKHEEQRDDITIAGMRI